MLKAYCALALVEIFVCTRGIEQESCTQDDERSLTVVRGNIPMVSGFYSLHPYKRPPEVSSVVYTKLLAQCFWILSWQSLFSAADLHNNLKRQPQSSTANIGLLRHQ